MRGEAAKRDDVLAVSALSGEGVEALIAKVSARLTHGHRRYQVTLAEANRHLGGRIAHESTLPGLATWGRVRDWRMTMLAKLPNVQIFRESRMGPDDIEELNPDHTVLATGSRWRRDGVGVVEIAPRAFPNALTPDDVFAGATVTGPVVIYDDEHYFMGGALAEKLARSGHAVTLVTPIPISVSVRIRLSPGPAARGNTPSGWVCRRCCSSTSCPACQKNR